MNRLFQFLDRWLSPTKPQTGGEDIADTIGLIVIMALLCAVVFM
jgi:hypothetical protein